MKLKINEQINRYSDVVPYEKRKYWYFTTHGVQPGSIPKGVNVLDIVEGESRGGMQGTFVMLDAILNTSELKEFDMKEESPMKPKKEVNEALGDSDFKAFITNLGKYNEGELVGKWVSFPIDEDDFE